ncbi:MAG: serine/threonine-protein kinase, partial [Bryobacteraceae bacterium]
MLREKWDQAQQLFLAAADLAPSEQARFLDKCCAGDRELRAEVESLIQADTGSGEFIAAAVEGEASLLLASQFRDDRLGPYRILRQLGRGGMGAVFLAIRDDQQYRKQVAIKIVKRGMDTAEVLQRFRHERQILANLDHPFIAHLYDGGTTLDGLPFFVMEYVEGQPLDVFCQQHELDTKTRLRLFLKICEAVAYAHRNLVVHRDLKPANICVTATGTPKLLDFGIAKLVTAEPKTMTTALQAFTPDYASPEQVRGEPISTATDVYSLGAVLYELLTGERAHKTKAVTPLEVDRAICHAEVTRPSVFAPALASDLDTIVLMAMRKEPGRRYASVDQFAADIQHYLDGEPVIARRSSFWYRTRKFARRNRFAVAAAVLILVSLLAALVVTVSEEKIAQSARHTAEVERTAAERERARAQAGFRQAEAARAAELQQRLNADQQRDRALRERARAEQRLTQLLSLADQALFQIHDAVARLPGATEARKVLVRTTLNYLESLEKEHGLDDRLRLSLAAGYSKTAAIEGDPARPSLGDSAGARDSYLKAESLLAPLYARRKNDPDVIARWLEIEAGLAGLSANHFKRQQGIEMYLRLIPVAHRLAELRPSDPQAVKQEAVIHGALATAWQHTEPTAALDQAHREIAIMETLAARFPQDRDLKEELAASLSAAAGSLKALFKLANSAEYYDRSVRIREQLLETEPHNVLVQRNLLVSYGNYAGLLGGPLSPNMGRFDQARSYGEKSVALARELAAADPQDKNARSDLGMSLGRLGMIEPHPGQVDESLKTLLEALTILDPIGKADPNSSSFLMIAMMRQYAGYRSQTLGQPADAAKHFSRSLGDLEALLILNPGQVSGTALALSSEEGLVETSLAQGDRAAALFHALHSVDRAEKYVASYPGLDIPLQYLGDVYF